MRFWDSSAIVPLLVTQPATAAVEALLAEVSEMVWWWGTPVECTAALARLRREGAITVEDESRRHDVLERLRESCVEMQPTERVLGIAKRLLRTHPLRTGAALQLAAALEWAGTPARHVLVTFDTQLADAARLEGFMVLPVR